VDNHTADLHGVLEFLKELKGKGLATVELELGDMKLKVTMDGAAQKFELPTEFMSPEEEKDDKPKGSYEKAFEVLGVKDAS
jgi:hypothetical protein